MRRPDEDLFVALAKEVPGFAGYYVDSQNRIVAYVTDSAQFGPARSALQSHLSSDRLGLPRSFQPADVLVRKGTYSFQQLSDFRDLISDRVLGSVPGAIYDDLDEARNRVTVGVLKGSEGSIQTSVLALIAPLGVPAEAIHFESTAKPIPATGPTARASGDRNSETLASAMTSATALNATADTIAGGFQVDRPPWFCSIGMILDRNGTRFASTASHCGSTMFALDPGDQWYQVYSRYIGNEAWDTTLATRYGDVELIQLQNTPSMRGTIGRTIQRLNGASASRDIDTGRPFIYVFATSTPVTGLIVQKEGRTTGWTYGTITATCQDMVVDFHTVYCEIKTSVWVGQGDSGSSLWSWDGQDGATLYGISLSLVQGEGTEVIDGIYTTVGGTSWFASYNCWLLDIGTSGLTVTTGVVLGSVVMSGQISSGNPVPMWTPPTVTNGSSAATHYTLYRSTLEGGTVTEQDNPVATYYAGTEWLDLERTVVSYNGTSVPSPHYDWVSYRVVAYNGGVTKSSSTVYFRMN